MAKRKFYVVVDTETATIPMAGGLEGEDKKKIAITFPLVYDLGFTFTNGKGEILEKRSFLIKEIFENMELFNTAYYRDKRPIYEKKLKKGEIQLVSWMEALKELEKFADKAELLCASNATFDFKKAIPFTCNYIFHFYYKNDGKKWLDYINRRAKRVLIGCDSAKNPKYLNPVFRLFKKDYKICDLWGIGVERLANNSKYKKFCLKNGYLTNSGQYFSTTVETLYKYLTNNTYFIESHTALEDAVDESFILKKVLKKGGISANIKPFPFKLLGNTFDFVQEKANKKYTKSVVKVIENYLANARYSTNYTTKLENILATLESVE